MPSAGTSAVVGVRSSAVARRASVRRAEQQPEVAQRDVVVVGLQEQVDDDPAEPGGDEVAAELGADRDDEAGDDLDDADQRASPGGRCRG